MEARGDRVEARGKSERGSSLGRGCHGRTQEARMGIAAAGGAVESAGRSEEVSMLLSPAVGRQSHGYPSSDVFKSVGGGDDS